MYTHISVMLISIEKECCTYSPWMLILISVIIEIL